MRCQCTGRQTIPSNREHKLLTQALSLLEASMEPSFSTPLHQSSSRSKYLWFRTEVVWFRIASILNQPTLQLLQTQLKCSSIHLYFYQLQQHVNRWWEVPQFQVHLTVTSLLPARPMRSMNTQMTCQRDTRAPMWVEPPAPCSMISLWWINCLLRIY